MAKRLTKETISAIRADNKLSLLVADELDIQVSSVSPLLSRNIRRFTEYPVLKVISDYIGKDIEELIEEDADTEIMSR